MREFKLPEQMFKNALTKCNEFSEFISTVNERMHCFDHYCHAVRIEYSAYFKVEFIYHNIDWPDDQETYICKFAVHPHDTIVGNCTNFKKILLNLFTQHFKDSFNIKEELMWYHKIDSIKVTGSPMSMYIERLMAWASDYVGLYYVEQECGEGWITLPKEPEQEIATYIKVNN